MTAAAATARPLVVVVHGGAWKIPDALAEASVRGVEAAARDGIRALLAGEDNSGQRDAVAAVVAAVTVLEDDPAFDAGKGSTLTAAGTVEMDAVVMRGDTLAIGAVAGIAGVKNPVQVADTVLKKSEHCMLVGAGATAFARQHGATPATDEELVTPAMRAEYEHYKQYGQVVGALFSGRSGDDGEGSHNDVPAQSGHDTVGAVALDALGTVVAATSTGGITAKLPGRVGDSPIAGAGVYADNTPKPAGHASPCAIGAACSTTGHGESILKVGLARSVVEGTAVGGSDATGLPQPSVEAALAHMGQRVGGHGGCISVSTTGRVGVGFTTERMPWAVAYVPSATSTAADVVLASGIEPASLANVPLTKL